MITKFKQFVGVKIDQIINDWLTDNPDVVIENTAITSVWVTSEKAVVIALVGYRLVNNNAPIIEPDQTKNG